MAGRGKRGKADFFAPHGGSGSDMADAVPRDGQLGELLNGQKEMMAALQTIQAQMSSLEKTVGKIDERLGALQGKVKSVESTSESQGQKIVGMEVLIASLGEKVMRHETFDPAAASAIVAVEARIERLENQRRECNVRLLGLPPVPEGISLKNELEQLIRDIAPTTEGEPEVKVKKIRRLPSNRKNIAAEKEGGTVLITVGAAEQRDRLLKAAAIKGKVTLLNSRILLFPDVSSETQQKRQRMAQLRKELVKAGHRASIWHPAKLRVNVNGKDHSFTDCKAAEAFVSNLRNSDQISH